MSLTVLILSLADGGTLTTFVTTMISWQTVVIHHSRDLSHQRVTKQMKLVCSRIAVTRSLRNQQLYCSLCFIQRWSLWYFIIFTWTQVLLLVVVDMNLELAVWQQLCGYTGGRACWAHCDFTTAKRRTSPSEVSHDIVWFPFCLKDSTFSRGTDRKS